MRDPVLLSALLLVAACGSTSREEVPVPETPPEPAGELFLGADSLAMAGDFLEARDSLVRLMEQHPERTDEVLFRLLGLHHGQAAEDQLIMLLDSLEMVLMQPLTGWKVSAMDMAGRPEEALLFMTSGDPFLISWLEWEIDSVYAGLSLTPDLHPGNAWVLSRTAPSGSLALSELAAIARSGALFPSVRTLLLREATESEGEMRMALLELIPPGPERELLVAETAAQADSGDLAWWLGQLEGDPRTAAVAAGELLERYPVSFSPSWSVVDALVSLDSVELAGRYSLTGDQWHRAGARMSILLHDRDYDQLLELVEQVGPGSPDSLAARSSLFEALALRASGGSSSRAYSACLDFAMRYPWHGMAREMAYDAGKYHDCEQEWSEGAGAYLASLRSSGSFEGDERAHWRGGFCLYMSGDLSIADSLWSAGCSTWPAGYWRDEMLFWRARLNGETGRYDVRDSLLAVVSREHPWEFYGMLAAERLVSGTGPVMTGFEIDLRSDPVCSLAVELTAMGYGKAALELLERGACSSQVTAAAALSLMGRHGSALRILRMLDMNLRENGRMLPDSLLWLYFPSPYRDLASLSTAGLLLESSILQGIMREESYFDRWVVSRAGARGVVQLMESTASDVARWYDLPPLSEPDFFDPAASVPYGALYIDRQYRSFQGCRPLFLAAYNAGPGNASRWVDMHGWNPEDPEMYIEQITYRETRIYVKKVLRSAWIYERR